MNDGSPLSRVIQSRSSRPHFVLLYGVDGVGKTTFGAQTPAPIFLGTEEGWGHLNPPHFPEPRDFNEVMAFTQDLITGNHAFKSLVLDTLDWIEPLVHAHVCDQNGWRNIEDAGYGKGYVAANAAWLDYIKLLKRLRSRMHVIALAHSTIKVFNDPEHGAAYDRYQLKLAGSGSKTDASALWREAVDCVLFANFEVTTETKKGDRKAKAYGDGVRVMFTERRPAFDAKNRFALPFELPLSWQAFADACEASRPSAPEATDEERAQVAELAKGREADAAAFFVARSILKAGDTLAALPTVHVRRILNNPQGFLAAIKPATDAPLPQAA